MAKVIEAFRYRNLCPICKLPTERGTWKGKARNCVTCSREMLGAMDFSKIRNDHVKSN